MENVRKDALPERRFRLNGVVPILLLLGGFASSLSKTKLPQDDLLAMRPKPIGEVRGAVTRLGRPVAGARIFLKDETRNSVVSGSDGGFRLASVPVGDHRVEVEMPDSLGGYVSPSQPITIGRSGDVARVRLEVQKGAVLRGRLVDPQGRPVLKARIQILRKEPTGEMVGRFAELSGNGVFEARVPAGDWLVEELPEFGQSSTPYPSWDFVRVRDGETKELLLRRIQRVAD